MSEAIVSGQTLNTVRKVSAGNKLQYKPSEMNKQVRVLHIQVDEDHIKCQDGSTLLGKLVYITEGYKGEGKRRGLKPTILPEFTRIIVSFTMKFGSALKRIMTLMS